MRELRNREPAEDDNWDPAPREMLWPTPPSGQLSRLSSAAAELRGLIANINGDPFLNRLLATSDEEEALDLAGSHSGWMRQAVQLTRDQQAELQTRSVVDLPISSGVTRARQLQADPAGFALSQRRPLPEFLPGAQL